MSVKVQRKSISNFEKVTGKFLKRDVVRTAFLVFFAAMMVQLWLFARWALGMSNLYVPRPNAVEGFTPIGAYVSLFTWLKTGIWDTVVPAGQVIVLAALLMTILLKRGFCGWICPVGAFFEIPANLGRRWRKNKQPNVNKWVDNILNGLRNFFAVVLLVFFLGSMTTAQSLNFLRSPFYAVSDIKIVQLFVYPPLWWLVAMAGLIVLSFFYGNVWCRWFCPLGGIYGMLSKLSWSTIFRDKKTCIDCGKCARVCPSRIPVDKIIYVRDTECDGCQTCVQACPVANTLMPRVVGVNVSSWQIWTALALLLWFGIYLVALFTGNWNSSMPVEYFRQALQSVGL